MTFILLFYGVIRCYCYHFHDSMYECRICDFKTQSPYSYMKHFRVHSGAITVPCGVPGCTRAFRKMGAFYCHLSRDYLHRQRSPNFLQNVGCTIRCEVASCQQSIPFADMVKHLKVHIAAGQTITCPALGCGRKMAKRSTFSAHISINLSDCVSTVSSLSGRYQLRSTGSAD